jgi:hypothetical protein
MDKSWRAYKKFTQYYFVCHLWWCFYKYGKGFLDIFKWDKSLDNYNFDMFDNEISMNLKKKNRRP